MDSPHAIAKWAERQDTRKSNTSTQHRLSDTDKALALQYDREGVTQVEIAKRLGVTQPAISQWLSKCRDTSDAAGLYLRGSALRMAKNVVRKGQARDHIQALKGIGVLADDSAGQGITIQIGIKDSEVTFASKSSTVSEDIHRPSAHLGSDNNELC